MWFGVEGEFLILLPSNWPILIEQERMMECAYPCDPIVEEEEEDEPCGMVHEVEEEGDLNSELR